MNPLRRFYFSFYPLNLEISAYMCQEAPHRLPHYFVPRDSINNWTSSQFPMGQFICCHFTHDTYYSHFPHFVSDSKVYHLTSKD